MRDYPAGQDVTLTATWRYTRITIDGNGGKVCPLAQGTDGKWVPNLDAAVGVWQDDKAPMAGVRVYQGSAQVDYAGTDNAWRHMQTLRPGYKFVSWQGASVPDGEMSTVLKDYSQDLVLVAQWQVIEYPVTFDDGYGETYGFVDAAPPGVYTVETGFSLPSPVRLKDADGYAFDGWTWEVSGGNEANPSQSVPTKPAVIPTGATGAMRFTAHFSAQRYSIDYDFSDDAGSTRAHWPEGQTPDTSYSVESSDIALKEPVREGYVFVGWSGSNGSEPERGIVILAGSMGARAYVAHWRPIAYTIELQLGDGASWAEPGSDSLDICFDEDVQLPGVTDAKRPGHVLAGWRYGGTGEGGATYMPGEVCEAPNWVTVDGAVVEMMAVWEKALRVTVPSEASLSIMLEWEQGEIQVVEDEARKIQSLTTAPVAVEGIADVGVMADGEIIVGDAAVFGDNAGNAYLTVRAGVPGAQRHKVPFKGSAQEPGGLKGLSVGASDGVSPVELPLVFGLDVGEIKLGDIAPWVNAGVARLCYTVAIVG